jgi:hypothetical protein
LGLEYFCELSDDGEVVTAQGYPHRGDTLPESWEELTEVSMAHWLMEGEITQRHFICNEEVI